MRIALAATYRSGVNDGAQAHIGQFVRNTLALGHEVWMWPGRAHPGARVLGATRLARLRRLRAMDALYVRLEYGVPVACRWALPPFRQFVGARLHVWEFNTVPALGESFGLSGPQVAANVARLRQYGRGCDMAVCVSERLAAYVRDRLRIRRVRVVPNGSDPDLYRPDAPPVPRVRRDPATMNVAWIGSAYVGWHDLPLLARAAQRLHAVPAGTGIAFHLLGAGMPAIADLPPTVHYHGVEAYDRLPGWLAAADVGVCVYRPGAADYGSPLKLFDYLASGLAVVSTPHPQAREVLGQIGATDLFVPHGDAAALAERLSALARDRPRVRELGLRGRALVIAKYTWRRAVEEILNGIAAVSPNRVARRPRPED